MCMELGGKNKWRLHICFFIVIYLKSFGVMLSDLIFLMLLTLSILFPLNMLFAVNPEDNALEHMMNFIILCKMFYSLTKIFKITT